MIAEVSEDLRFGLRLLSKRPAFAFVAILSLALGIGANTAMFTLLDAVFFRPLRVEDPSALVHVRTVDENQKLELGALSRDNLLDLRAKVEAFEAIEGEVPVEASLQLDGAAEPVHVSAVTDGFFAMLGIEAARGRFIDARDAGSDTPPRLVLAHHVWQSRFGADPEIVGKRVRLSGVDFEVIGVGPDDFAGLYFPAVPQGWTHADQVYRLNMTLAGIYSRRGLTHHSVARIAEGVSETELRAQLQRVSHELAERYPDANRGRSFEVLAVSDARVEPAMKPMARRAGLLLFGVVGFVLLIACANVANLLLARSSERRGEIAVRLAMGGTPGRVLRQLLTESLLLSLLGGAIGIVIALWGVDLVWALQPGEHWEAPPIQLGLDGRVLGFTLGLSLVTALGFGLLPAWRAANEPLITSMRADDKVTGYEARPPRMRRVLVAGQVALSLVAMVGAGLFVRSLQSARDVEPGFEIADTGIVELSLPADFDERQRERAFEKVLGVARSVPGVRTAGLAEDPPMRRSVMRTVLVEHDGARANRGPIIDVNGISEGYLETIGIDLVEGQAFEHARTQGDEEVLMAIVNETARKQLWPDGGGIGSRFRFMGFPISHEVVAIAEDAKVFRLHEAPQPMIYVWMAQQRHPRTTIVLRAEGEVQPVLDEVQAALSKIDPRISVPGAQPLRAVVDGTLWGDRLGAGLLVAFAVLALVLSAIGVYGLSTYVVGRRTREVGVRMALGAEPGQLRWLLVRQTLAPVLAGVAAGLLLALAVSPLIEGMVYDVPLADPRVYLPAAIVLITVATLAAWLPARRATRMHPMEALRR